MLALFCRPQLEIHIPLFFFQAEDGIRDFHVTGVQTCALPIFTRDDFKEAVEKVMMGERLERKPRGEGRERIAHHEAAHALISELVKPGSVSSITITSRGKALGYMRQAPEDGPYLYTKQELLDQIAVCMAGACAEEVFFGSRSTGSRSEERRVGKEW